MLEPTRKPRLKQLPYAYIDFVVLSVSNGLQFDNVKGLGSISPAAVVPVDRPMDTYSKAQGVQFFGFAYANLNQPTIVIEADTPFLTCVTNFRVSLISKIISFLFNSWDVEYEPEKDLTPRITVDYPGSKYSSFTPKTCAIAAGAATGGALTGISTEATVIFTCIKAYEDKRVTYEATYKPNGKKMTSVKFPDWFADCKDTEVEVKGGILNIDIFGAHALLATLIDTLVVILKKKECTRRRQAGNERSPCTLARLLVSGSCQQ
jgi:hypothetical protein